MMGQVEFQLLGPLQVRRDGAPLVIPPGLPRVLLGRLLVGVNTVVAADQLVEELWRGSPPASSGHALRVYISSLRRLLEPDRAPGAAPELLITRRPGYLLAVPPGQTDADRFEQLVAEGADAFAAGRMAEASSTLAGALGLWRGPVLSDLGDETFVGPEAARLGELRWVAADRWAEAELALGRHAELVGELEALIRLDPFRERLWAQLIVALYRSGRQAEALQTYQRLRALLVDQLGLEPSPPLRQLEAAVLRQDPDLAVPAGITQPVVVVSEPGDRRDRPASAPGGERTPFVGRETELAGLGRLLDQAAAGAGGLLMIGGEPGVGKSRLVEEIAIHARAGDRFRVLIGHCYESGRDAPYMPWVEMIETAMSAAPPDELLRRMDDAGPELARLVPELRRVVPGIPPPVEVSPDQQRRYTFNSIRDFLYRVSREQPRLYILEDLHWADEPTLSLLEHVADGLSGVPCLVVGTFRDPPADVSPQLAETLGRLVRRHVRIVSLKRHTETEVDDLLRAMSGQNPPARVGAAVYQETEGNAFLVEEVFRHFAENGRLFDDHGYFRDDIAISDLDVPSNVRLVTGQRLGRLSEATQQMLGVAAVASRHMGFELLEAIADLKGDDLIDALDEAERAGVIFTDPAADEEEYWFAHELTRQTILTQLPAARRRRHHLRVAEAMEQVFADDLDAHAATIAQHLGEAGSTVDRSRLFRYLLRAGTRALGSAAVEDALRHLHRAADLVEYAAPAEQADLYYQLGMAERGAGRFADALPPWLRAVEIYEELGDAEAVGRVCLAAAYNLAWAGQIAESVEMADRGVAGLGALRTGDRSRLLALSGSMTAGVARYGAGMARVEEALALAEELDDRGALGYVLFWKTIGHVVYMEMADAVTTGRRGAEILRTAGDLWALAGTLGFLAEALVNMGAFDEAEQVEREVAPLAERVGNSGATWHSVMVQGALTFCRTGSLDGLEAIARREIELCEEAGMGWASWGWSWLALVELLRGHGDQAIAYGEKAEALAAPTTMKGLEWAIHFESRARCGQRDVAMAMLECSRDLLPRVGEPAGWGPWVMLVSAVEGLVALGGREEAAALYPAVLYGIERTRAVNAYPNDCKLLERIAGMAAAAGSDWDAAEAHFVTALQQAEALPHLPEQAHTRRAFSAMLLERDGPEDRQRAEVLSAEAEELYSRLGFRLG